MADRSKRHLLFITLWLLALGSAFNPHSTNGRQASPDLAEQAKTLLQQRCFQCHGQNGKAAKGIFLLDYTRLISSQIVIPGDPASRLLNVVESGAMPLGMPELSSEEKALLRSWILKGALSWRTSETRKFLTDAELIAFVLSDLEKAPARERRFLRYFSLAHLYNAGVVDEELDSHRAALSKLLNSLSWHREITPSQPIDPNRTLFRIDLRDYEWTDAAWRTILTAYPYGLIPLDAERIAVFSGEQVPFVRADWFVARASEPPLYHELLGLPLTIAELERRLGVNSGRNLIEEKHVIRAGVRTSGVSQNNRALERHIAAFGAYWRSFDFRSNIGDQNLFADPLRLNPAGGEIIFNLPNGLQAYFLIDGHGRRIDAAPIEIVSDRNRPDDPVIRNGRSCMSCHFSGVKSFNDDVRPALVKGHTVAFELERARALYAPQERLNRALAEDEERFRRAEALTGAKAANNANAEPINALAHRFQSELGVAQAAAEVGLEARDLKERARWNVRLNSLGLGQLLDANGGFKRDTWERNFGEIVRELQLGVRLAGREINSVRGTWSRSTPNSFPAKNIASRQTSGGTSLSSDLLQGAKSVMIRSGTVYLRPELLEAELQKSPQFQSLGIEIVKDAKAADLRIDLNRPLFTFDFTYSVTHRQSSTVLLSGKVVAFDGRAAAPKIAKELNHRMQVTPPQK